MAKALSLGVGTVGLLGAAALFVVAAPGTAPPTVDLAQPVAADLDGRLRETLAGVHARVTTLADLPRLQAAVSTDATTVRDLTQDELAFRTGVDETIVIGQVPKGGKPVVLLQLPSNGTALPLDPPGVRIEIHDGKLFLSEAMRVTPRERAGELSGALAIGRRVDLSPIQALVDKAGRGARLEMGGAWIGLSAHSIPDGAQTMSAPLTSEPGRGATLVLEASSPSAASASRPLQLGGLGLAIATLIGAALLWRRQEQVAAVQPAAPSLGPRVATKQRVGSAPTLAAAPAADSAGLQLDVIDERSSIGILSKVSAPSPSLIDAPRVGRYTLLKRLGSGGMAEVYLARSSGEAGFEKLIALKVMLKDLAKKPIIVEHFLDEARLASRLTHPNIVQITDLGKAGDSYYIAMEYIEGADLHRLMQVSSRRKIDVPFRVALTVIRRVCDGLHAAHIATDANGGRLDLVHRDVKAANVFIARNGAVKVGDFGIAKANQAHQSKKTEIGQVKGTVGYMAPEHRMGHPVDPRADIYGVGAIAYELLTGIEINLDFAMLAQLGKQGWPHLALPSQVRGDLPPELDAVLWKALAFEKEDRYVTCAEMEEALEAIANQYPPVAGEKAIAQWVETELAAEIAAETPAANG